MSVSLVSGLILAPTKIITEPIITFMPRRIGIHSTPFESIVTAINGDHDPKIKPPL